jgi:cysteinylglycine-S-conjugate dipeptidase
MPAEELPSAFVTSLREAIRGSAPKLLGDLARLVGIPSVSWNGFDQAHVEASAQTVSDLCAETGLFDEIGLFRIETGAPAVVARKKPGPNAPTVVLYAHHDVQPPGMDEDWISPPWQMTLRDHRLYGRGSADDKAGIGVHLGALVALASLSEVTLDLGIILFVEGEEENGSPSFPAFLKHYRDELAGDIIVVADSDNPSTKIPALTTRLRGNVTAVLEIKTLDHALHSGMFGGVVPDAMMAFVGLAAAFYDEQGSVAIAGLHTSAEETAGLEQNVGEEAGLLDGVTEIGSGSVSARLWDSPALTITGLDVPSIENASNTLLPTVRAKISLRVAPSQSPEEAFTALEAHIMRHMPFGASWTISEVSHGEGFTVREPSLGLELAEQALSAGFGFPAVRQGVGGSIPFIAELAKQFPEAHIVVTGVEDPDTRAHSPNESLDLGVWYRAMLSEAIFLELVNRRKVSDFH